MEKLTNIQKQILRQFWEMQCDIDDGYFRDDETPAVRYANLLEITTKERLKPEMIELRNEGIIFICMTVDSDYMPSGSGYVLTDKGFEIVKELFYGKN